MENRIQKLNRDIVIKQIKIKFIKQHIKKGIIDIKALKE